MDQYAGGVAKYRLDGESPSLIPAAAPLKDTVPGHPRRRPFPLYVCRGCVIEELTMRTTFIQRHADQRYLWSSITTSRGALLPENLAADYQQPPQ